MSEVNNNAPFLLIQKPQELIKLFEGLIDRKIREIGTLTPTPPVSAAGESPFLSTKEVQKIFGVSRQTINDWREAAYCLPLRSNRGCILSTMACN